MKELTIKADTIVKIEGIPFLLKKDSVIHGMPENLKAAEEARKLHRSDCAVNNGPAYESGPCDCGASAFVDD